MKKLFGNFWVTCGMLLAAVLLDLIALTSKSDIGAGFILLFIYFAIGSLYTIRNK